MDNEFEIWLKKIESEIKKDEKTYSKSDVIYKTLDLKVDRRKFQTLYDEHIKNYGNKLLFVVTPERIPESPNKAAYHIDLIEKDIHQKTGIRNTLFSLIQKITKESEQANLKPEPFSDSEQAVHFLISLIEKYYQLDTIAHYIFKIYYNVMPKCQAISSTYIRNKTEFQYLFFPEPNSTLFTINQFSLEEVVSSKIFTKQDLEAALQTIIEDEVSDKFNFVDYYWLSLFHGIGRLENEHEVNEMVGRLIEIAVDKIQKTFPVTFVDNLNEIDSGTIVELRPNTEELGFVRGTVIKL